MFLHTQHFSGKYCFGHLVHEEPKSIKNFYFPEIGNNVIEWYPILPNAEFCQMQRHWFKIQCLFLDDSVINKHSSLDDRTLAHSLTQIEPTKSMKTQPMFCRIVESVLLFSALSYMSNYIWESSSISTYVWRTLTIILLLLLYTYSKSGK